MAPFTVEHRAQFADTDAAGIVHFTTILFWVEATEEAIVNALVAARDMQGHGGNYAKALPHAELVRLLQKYGRLAPSAARR